MVHETDRSSPAPQRERSAIARSVCGATNVVWALLLTVLWATILWNAESLDSDGIALVLLVPTALLQAIAGLGVMAQRRWARRLLAVVGTAQLALCGYIALRAPLELLGPVPAVISFVALGRPLLAGSTEEPRDPWRMARDILGIGNALFGLGLLLAGSAAMINASRPAAIIISAGLVASFMAQLVGGLRLVTQANRAVQLLTGAAIAQVVLFGWSAVEFGTQDYALLLLVPSVGTVLCLMHPSIRPAVQTRLPYRKIAIAVFASLLGFALLLVAVIEIRDIRQALANDRFRRDCEATGDVEACGWAALNTLRGSDTVDPMPDALTEMDALCADGNIKACRFSGYIRTDTYSDIMHDGARVLRDDLRTKAMARCNEGDEQACLVLAWTSNDPDDARALCAAGTRLACRAWSVRILDAGRTKEEIETAFDAACKAGFGYDCGTKPPAARTLCTNGYVAACDGVEGESELEHDMFQALALAGRSRPNVALYDVDAPDTHDYVELCEGGENLACLVAGLQLFDDGNSSPTEPHDLPPRHALDATLGRACDGGLNAACIAYGARLIDRPLDEKRDIDGANARFQQACDRGAKRACWLRDYERELLTDDFEGYRHSAEVECRRIGESEACEAYASILAADLELAPWPMNDDLGYPRLRKTCLMGDAVSCMHVAQLLLRNSLDEPAYVGGRITAFDAASRGCRGGDVEACRLVLTSAADYWPDHEDALREKICAKVPEACI